MRTRTLSLAWFLVAAAVTSACTIDIDARGFIQHDRKSFPVSGTPEINLATFDGSIEIRGSERTTVEIEIEKRASTRELVESIEVEAVQDGDRIRVEARRKKSDALSVDLLRGPGLSVRLVALVPLNSRIYAQTGDGSVSAERIDGRIELRTADGSVRGVDLAGELHVVTGDGSVKLDQVRGQLDVRTGDGSITLNGHPTALRLHTDDGSMTIRVEEGTSMSGDWDLTTGDGRVVMYLPRSFAAELDATTGDGRIHSDLHLTDGSEAGEMRRERRGRLGEGGHVLKIRTSDGNISIRPA